MATANAPETSLFPPVKPTNFGRIAAEPYAQIVANAGVSGKVGFVVADADTGEVHEAYNAFLALPPASVAKAVTAQYAIDGLGMSYQFQTKLIATGPISNGRIKGDLVLVGGGDPTLSTDALADLASTLKAAGVHGVDGEFLVYSSVLPYVRAIDNGQPDHVGYNPAVSGLNLNFNRVHFEWKRANAGYSVAMDARTGQYRPEVQMAKMVVKKRSVPIYTYADGEDTEHWTVASGALGDGGSRWLPVRRPELYAADVFRTMARAHGIELKKERVVTDAPQGDVVAEFDSSEVRDIVRGMLKYSTNITAEVLGLETTRKREGRPSDLTESGAAMARWAAQNAGMTNAKFVDHSGLSDQSRVAAREMVSALVAAKPNGPLHELMKDIRITNSKGEAIQNFPAQVRAKTGTLNFVSALAGYITTASGANLAFAIFTANMDERAKIAREDREVPPGARPWARRSRRMQQELLQRWAKVY
ncbi:D-alanyl-D-alanine carboxypeptidase/D-alanyl-D-alanine-endopeptidase [Falsihalocynthiibacter sp. SS001]|uniref:D-alanyl-D-alanine carboxypeptidase/D-alanyl-D-alanine endopeptidase n=1 Tax=Falsihalocynthiibacter sp. SS001 TaxID=3349698 RepID=UPI0036D364FE